MFISVTLKFFVCQIFFLGRFGQKASKTSLLFFLGGGRILACGENILAPSEKMG